MIKLERRYLIFTSGLVLAAFTTLVCQVADSMLGKVETPFEIRRELAEVWAGADVANLPRLADNDWHAFEAGSWVTTDESGEGWLQIEDCLRVYIFQASQLVKAACPKSDFQAGNVTCSLEGTSAFNNSCASQVVIQTPSAAFTLEGTWVAVTYLPDQDLSVILVPEGQVDARPVTNATSYTLGAPITIEAGQFWFSMPDSSLASFAGLEPRTPHGLTELSKVLDNFALRPWIYRIWERANRDQIPPPPAPPEIVSVEFPAEIPANTSTNDPLTGLMTFRDLDRDVISVTIDVLDSDLRSPGIEAGQIDIQGSDSGVVPLSFFCQQQSGQVRLSLRINDQAGYQSEPFEFSFTCLPEPPTPTPQPPNLVVSQVEVTEDPWVNSEGQVMIPVRVQVQNRGDLNAGPFKLSASYTSPRGSFLAPFSSPGQENIFYPFLESGLEGGQETLVTGELLLHSSTQGETVTVQVLADSCAGEEFPPQACRVVESDEEDNLSTELKLRLPVNRPPSAVITIPKTDPEQFDLAYRFDGLQNDRWYTDVRLAGSASDEEDGVLDSESIVWTTNRTDLQDEFLGTGRSLTARLFSGQQCLQEGTIGDWHVITMTATDSNGQVTTQSRRIFVWTTCIL